MGLRRRAGKTTGAGGGGRLLMEEIEAGIDAAVRRLLEKGDLGVGDLMKIRDVAREILAERPRQITVRWVDSWEGTKDETNEGPTGEKGTKKDSEDPSPDET